MLIYRYRQHVWFARLIVSAVVSTFPPQVLAQIDSAATNTLSLSDAKRIAFERSWDLLAAKSGMDAAQAQLIVAREFPNPTAAISTAKIGGSEAGTTLGNSFWERNYDSIAAVSQLIEIGGKRHSRQLSAHAGIVGARATFFDAQRLLDQGVTKAYIAAVLSGENARILKESARMLRNEVEIAQTRLNAGDIADSDEKQIEINADQFELQARSAEAAAVQARIAVEVLLGINKPHGNWTPTDSLAELVQPDAVSVANTNELKPEVARPDVLAADASLQNSVANVKLQKANRIPDPTLSLGVEHEPPGGGPPVDTLNFGVSFPLPLWNWNRGNIKAAEVARNQAEIALEKAKAQVMADIAGAENEYDEAFQRWQRYQNQTVPKSAKVRASVAFAYEKGGASLVDLLEAERTDNDVRLAAEQAQADTASAVTDLKAATDVMNSSNTFP